jgi:hypothetical protein
MSNQTKSNSEFAEYEWMMEEGADEKLQREVEEELKMAELERLMMQEEKESGDLQMMDQMSRLSTSSHRRIPVIKTQLNVNAPVFVPSWEKTGISQQA